MTAPPSGGVVPPGVVVGMAQNGTVGCEKAHSRKVSIGAAESAPRVTNLAWPSGRFSPKVLEAAAGDAYDAPPFFGGWLDSSVGRATD